MAMKNNYRTYYYTIVWYTYTTYMYIFIFETTHTANVELGREFFSFTFHCSLQIFFRYYFYTLA